MDNFNPKLEFARCLGDSRAAVRFARRSLCLLFLFGLMGGAAAGAEVHDATAASARPWLPFAIADFDGDSLPDIVSVQTGQSDFSRSEYWIQLELTTAGRQSIRLVAPAGGLLIEARDVNGDHAVDLVLTTAWFRQPVAILLNNGHGGFSRVEPDSFPGAFTRSTTNWASASDQATGADGVLPQLRPGICSKARDLVCLLSEADTVSPSRAKLLLDAFLLSHFSRAPPTFAWQSRLS